MLKDLGLAKEGGDGDQEVAEQRLRLIRVLAQKFEIGRRTARSRHLHPPGDSPQHGGTLVLGEIVSRAHPDESENLSERAFVSGRQVVDGDGLLETDQIGKAGCDVPDRQNKIDNAGRDRVARHRGVFGFVGILDKNNSAALFDGAHAQRSVRARSAQDDGEAVAEALRQ